MVERIQRGWVLALSMLGVAGETSLARAMPHCAFESISGMSFGAYRITASEPTDSVAFVSFTCEDMVGAQPVNVQLSRGSRNSFIPRVLVGPGTSLEYNLYLDAARTVVWGDGTAGTAQFSVRPASGETVTMSVYGRIAAQQAVRAGVYSDVIVVTLVF